MPMSSAALAGIADNGLRWKARVRLSDLAERLRDDDALKVGDAAAIRDQYVNRVNAFLKTDKVLAPSDEGSIRLILADLEECLDDPDEVRGALNDLYDIFDYTRVCVL